MRKIISDEKKKKKTAVSIDKELSQILKAYLKDNNINRSRYIENLIREDMIKRGKNIERNF